ncbi:MAG: hypothetical protein IKG99_01100 [Bacteroidaceae bacterium]|nr:hypothetical protein [Bacteroidaceae bacterium]
MKKFFYLYKPVSALMFILMVCQQVQAQEAFYIYRNDGDFNGFFFDDVKSISYSKYDLDSIEHDVYVVEDIELNDTIYRIPLAAIDSMGFQQPEIIINENLYEINGPDSPVRSGGLGYYFEDEDGYTIRWSCDTEAPHLPEPGMILYTRSWKSNSYLLQRYEVIDEGPFVGKVVSVSSPEPSGYLGCSWYTVVCEPVDDISDVFEQLISVERLGVDSNGNTRRRMAGLDKVLRRVSDSKDLTIVNLDGHFPFSRGNDDFEFRVSLDMSLKVQANVAYNISRQDIHISVTLKEDAEVGVSFSAKANLEDVTTWHVGGLPVYFPSLLPIFQIDPSPEAFIKTTGDLSVSVSTPKFAYHGTQYFHLGTDGLRGSVNNDPTSPGDGNKSNGWSFSVALNGSLQAGSNFPMKLETNRWAKKGIYAAVGANVYVGPKLSASFAIDPVAAAKGELYDALSSTMIKFSPVCSVWEGIGEYSFRNKPTTKTKFFEGENSFFDVSLKLFPDFETTVVTQQPESNNSLSSTVKADIFPRGYSLPYVVGLAAYNSKKELVSKNYETPIEGEEWNGRNHEHTYSFFNSYEQLSSDVEVIDGTYTIVPLIKAFGYDVPVFSSGVEVHRDLQPYLSWPQESAKEGDGDPTTGFVAIAGLLPDDVVIFEMVRSMTYTYERKDSWRWIDRALGRYEHNIEYEKENTTEGAGGASFADRGGYGGEFDGDVHTGVWKRLGAETAGARLYFLTNHCNSSEHETGEYIFDPYTFLTDAGSTYTVSRHYEACTYRAKILRRDGRVFYTKTFDLCGYGTKTNDYRTSYNQKMYPPGYSDYYVTFSY